MKFSDLIKFKVQNRYLDLPDDNYKQQPFEKALMIVARFIQAFSILQIAFYIYLKIGVYNQGYAAIYLLFISVILNAYLYVLKGFPDFLYIFPACFLLFSYWYIRISLY